MLGITIRAFDAGKFEEELRAITEYSQAGGVNRRGVGQDLAWALINSAEFGFRH